MIEANYPWYELLAESEEITQGDILKGCPVPILASITAEEGEELGTDIAIIDGIVMTQACDIVNNKVDHIVLCSIRSKTEYEKLYTPSKAKQHLEGIRKGQQPAYHLINKFEESGYREDFCVVNFKEIFSVPLEVAKKVALSNNQRLRLLPPYREHLSQAFARYFMRVGLPIDIRLD